MLHQVGDLFELNVKLRCQKLMRNVRFFVKKISVPEFVVCFLLGNSPAAEFYTPTFRNTFFHLHRQVGVE
jgi:hypothetical protein